MLALPFVVFLSFLVIEIKKPLPPPKPLPNPNGYDDLVKAGQMVSTNSGNYDSANLEQLRETVTANSTALALARASFSNECRVPVQSSNNYILGHIHDLIALRSLAHAFATEGKLAEKEKRFDVAAMSYTDVMHLANESARGGIVIDQGIGMAIEGLGLILLTNIIEQLDVKACRDVASGLENFSVQKQTWNQVLKQENDWSRRTYGGFQYEIARILQWKLIHDNFRKAKEKFDENQNAIRQLTIALATRAYTLDKGHPPTNVSDLVPDYLKTIPTPTP